MNTTRTVPTQFGPEVRFTVPAVAVAPFRATEETALDRLKDALLRRALNEVEPECYAPLRRAANDAVALAAVEPYPLLVLPALFDEKAQAARRYVEKQKQVRLRSRKLLLEAA